MTPAIQINPALEGKRLKTAFRKTQRLHIPNFLNPEAAEAIYRCLKDEIAWNLAYNDEKGEQHLFARDQRTMTAAERQAFHKKVLSRARQGRFSYLYGSFAIGDLYKQNLDRDFYLARLYEFLNANPFLDFMTEVTGIEDLNKASLQATAYGPGHFLTQHNDFEPKKDRKIAFVFNFTKNWRPEWGGVLQFIDKDGVHEEGLVPTFNALNFFAVPRRHIVSQVATYAGAVRYSLTGWLMGRDGD